MRDSRLRVVVIERAAAHWDNPLTQQLFCKMVSLKLRGFRRHGEDVPPVDGSDYYGEHVMLCGESADGELEPFLAWRSITYKTCQRYKQNFGPVMLARTDLGGSDEHMKAVQKIVDEYQYENLRYCSSYTITPDVRKFRPFLRSFKDIGTGVFVNFHRHYQTDKALIAGNVPDKVDQMFSWWGYSPITLDGRELPTVHPKFLNGLETRMFELFDFSDDAKKNADTYRSYWNERITLSENSKTAELAVKRQETASAAELSH